MKRLTLRDLQRAARKLSADIEIEDDREFGHLYAHAPPGCSWEPGLHYFTASYRKDPVWKSEAIADMIDRMSYGFEPCEIADCETCTTHHKAR